MMLRDIMTRDVLTTGTDVSVAEAARVMVERGIGSACLVDDAGLRGIITERDVLRAAASGRDLNAEPVTGWMTADPVTITPNELPSRVAAIMAERGFRHLPVVDQGELVGIISMRDVWRFSFLPSEPDDMTLRS